MSLTVVNMNPLSMAAVRPGRRVWLGVGGLCTVKLSRKASCRRYLGTITRRVGARMVEIERRKTS